MKSFDTELKKYTKKVRLRAAERREIRERILAYMEYHPLPKEVKKKLPETITSEHFVIFNFNTVYTKVAAGFFALLIVVSVPLAAERSVPGDVLYPVKTLNEGIRAQFVSSPYEQVAFETELMERRIAEARLLAKEGKLTEEVEAEIAATVKGHADAAQKGIEELKNADADEGAIAEIAFGTTLEVQSAVLDSGIGTGSTTGPHGIAIAVKEAKANVDAQKGTSTPPYELLSARVELETTRAYELIETVDVFATEEERADIERRLADIERTILAAEELQEEGDAEATVGLTDALALIQKLIVFMTDIDVRENVPLESIVPIVLTDEEKKTDIETRLVEITTTWEEVQPRIASFIETDMYEKLIVGAEMINRGLATTTTLLVEERYEAANNALLEVEALIFDLDVLTAEGQTDEIIEETEEEIIEEEFTEEETATSTDEVISDEPEPEVVEEEEEVATGTPEFVE